MAVPVILSTVRVVVPLALWAKNVLNSVPKANMVKTALNNVSVKIMAHVTSRPENVRAPKDGLGHCKS